MRLFDAHCDTIYQCYHQNQSLLKENPNGHVDLKRSKAFRNYVQFFAIFENGAEKSKIEMKQTFQNQYDIFLNEIKTNTKNIEFCKTARDAHQAFQHGKHAAFLSVEGAELLGCDIQMLEKAYELGVRSVTLTWNHKNELAGSSAQRTPNGLSEKGKQFVKKMQELSMIVDVSHISEAAFWDVVKITKAPIIASHSNFKILNNHPRNVTDEQFLALKDSGGVLGLNFYSAFLGENATIDTLLSHVEHAWSLDGQNSIAFGSDFDGCDLLPYGIKGLEDVERIYEALLRRNYCEIWVENLFYKNLMRVVSEVCTM